MCFFVKNKKEDQNPSFQRWERKGGRVEKFPRKFSRTIIHLNFCSPCSLLIYCYLAKQWFFNLSSICLKPFQGIWIWFTKNVCIIRAYNAPKQLSTGLSCIHLLFNVARDLIFLFKIAKAKYSLCRLMIFRSHYWAWTPSVPLYNLHSGNFSHCAFNSSSQNRHRSFLVFVFCFPPKQMFSLCTFCFSLSL